MFSYVFLYYVLVYMILSSKHYKCINFIMKLRTCLENSLNETLVQRKIVLCDELGTGKGPAKAGAAGCIMQGTVSQDVAFSYPLPASYLNLNNGSEVAKYLNSTRYFPEFLCFNLLVKVKWLN